MVNDEISNLCEQLLQLYKDKLKEQNNIASGKLYDTAKVITQWGDNYFEVFFELQDYWKYLEAGTKPHFPPVSAIEEWITAKKIVPRTQNGKVPTTKQLAFLISRSISEKGTKVYSPLQRSLSEADDLINKIAEEISKIFEEQLDKEIEEL